MRIVQEIRLAARSLRKSPDLFIWPWLEDAGQDLRFAARLFRKKPGITAIAALTLALGIGAASSVFSIVDAVLLRPLPYKDPQRLVAIWGYALHQRGMEKIFLPYTDFEEWSRSARSFASVTLATWAFSPSGILTGRGPAKAFLTIPVSASFFRTLGVDAALGRTFTAEDERRGCAVVLSYGFWSTTLGADRSIIGRSLTLDQRPCTVLGVMPSSFSFYPAATEMWILLGPNFDPPRQQADVGIFARLKPGVTREQAQAEMIALHRAANRSGFWHEVEPRVYDLQGEFTFLASRTLRITLLVAFAAVLFVLLIACLNVANLLLARLSDRQRELALRAALGSGKGRLARQMLTEGLLLSLIGTAGGILFGYAVVRYFRSASPIELTVGADVRLNVPVLLFSACLAIAATLLCGWFPALNASRIDVIEWLKSGGRGAVGRGFSRRTAQLMIAAETGLSVVLLIGAGLLLRSALRMGSEPLGYNPNGVFHTGVTLPPQPYREPARRIAFFEAFEQRLNRLPGVAGAALALRVPPFPSTGTSEAIEIQGHHQQLSFERRDVGLNAVSPGFFSVLQIPLRRGRSFRPQDREGGQPVAIINEALAREYFSQTDPIGQQIRVMRPDQTWLTIVGVAGNLKSPELMHEMSWVETPLLYRPLSQAAPQGFQAAVRAAAGAQDLPRQIQQQLEQLDSSVPINDVAPIAVDISKTLAYPRFRALVLGFFALAALLLSAVGLHGVLSQLVTRRTPEFGVRKAVGAQSRDILLLVARQGGVPVLIGLIAGLAATLAFSRLLTSLLYGIRPADPEVLVGVSLILLAVAAVAVLFAARRAASLDPTVALRCE
jgi:predicted permease